VCSRIAAALVTASANQWTDAAHREQRLWLAALVGGIASRAMRC
jgi:hypothetical protein